MFFIILVAVVYIVFTPTIYRFNTIITIGTTPQTQTQLIESPQAVIAILDNAIIPQIIAQQNKDNPNNQLNVSASIPKNTDSVLLTSQGTLNQKEAIVKLHQHITQKLHQAHQKKILPLLNYFNDELKSSQALLAQLNLRKQDESDNISEQIINLENIIRETKLSLAQFSDTHSAQGTVQSIKPTNKNSKLILAISIVLGLFAGVFAALFAGFLDKTKQQQSSSVS